MRLVRFLKHFKISKKDLCKVLDITEASLTYRVNKGLLDSLSVNEFLLISRHYKIPIKILYNHFNQIKGEKDELNGKV